MLVTSDSCHNAISRILVYAGTENDATGTTKIRRHSPLRGSTTALVGTPGTDVLWLVLKLLGGAYRALATP